MNNLLHYDHYTGIFTWKTSRGCKRAGQVAGKQLITGHISIKVNRKSHLAHRLAWLFVYGDWPVCHLDHIDQNPSNNRINNLREVTRSQNMQNQGKHKTNTSGFKGVTFHNNRKKWQAQIQAQGKRIYLGLFDTKEIAYSAYLAAQEKYHTHRPLLTGDNNVD